MGHPKAETFRVFWRDGSGVVVMSQSVGKLRNQTASYTSRGTPGHLIASYSLLKAVSLAHLLSLWASHCLSLADLRLGESHTHTHWGSALEKKKMTWLNHTESLKPHGSGGRDHCQLYAWGT